MFLFKWQIFKKKKLLDTKCIVLREKCEWMKPLKTSCLKKELFLKIMKKEEEKELVIRPTLLLIDFIKLKILCKHLLYCNILVM